MFLLTWPVLPTNTKKSSQNICHLVVNAAEDDIQTFVSDDSNFLYKVRIGIQKFFPIFVYE